MIYGESGGVVKQCERCGKIMEIENYFAACATKYCTECAAQVKRDRIAGYMREKRRKARERREMERQQIRMLNDENELLREHIRVIQYRLESAEAAYRKAVQNGE